MTDSVLSRFDKITAAGILARAALSLEDSENPAAATRIPDENIIRNKLLEEIRRSLGINYPFNSKTDVEMIVDALDNESDRLLEPVNESKVLDSLSAKGELPADLYEVSIDAGMLEVYEKKAEDERKLIERTVRFRDAEQHFTQKHDGELELPLISLFSKHIEHKFAARSFTLLVAGIRNGTHMHVSQAWRIYDGSPAAVAASQAPLDTLRNFADEFGFPFSCGQQSGKFILQSKIAGKSLQDDVEIVFKNPTNRPKKIKCVVSHFDSRSNDGTLVGSLVYVVDLIKYKRSLALHAWESERFEDLSSPMGTWQKK